MPRPEFLTPTRLLQTLSATPSRPAELAQALGVSRATIHRKLEKLLEDGLVVRVGEGPLAAYRQPSPVEELDKALQACAAERQVRLVMGRAAASAVQDALEFFSRIGIGQLGEIASRARFQEIRHADGSALTLAQLDQADRWADALKYRMLGLESSASFGIYSPHVHPKVLRAWGLQQALRHRLAWDRTPAGGMGVAYDEPMDAKAHPGLFVHSEAPDDKGQPSRYILEMPADFAQLLREVLAFSLRLTSGDVQAVVELAREQVLRHQGGAPVSEDGLELGAQIASVLSEVLSGTRDGGNVMLSKSSAHVLRVLKALEAYEAEPNSVTAAEPARKQASQGAVAGVQEEDVVSVRPVASSPWALSLDALPEGMMLNFRDGYYRVIGPTDDGEHLAIVAQSHSLKTALQMARNRCEGRRARTLS